MNLRAAVGPTSCPPSREPYSLTCQAGGFRSEAQLDAELVLTGRNAHERVIEAADIDPNPTPDIYTFSREIVQRNLYRVPLR